MGGIDLSGSYEHWGTDPFSWPKAGTLALWIYTILKPCNHKQHLSTATNAENEVRSSS